MGDGQPIETVPMRGFEFFEPVAHGHAPIKAWNRGVDFDANTISQLRNIASLPFIHSHVAAMPDAQVAKRRSLSAAAGESPASWRSWRPIWPRSVTIGLFLRRAKWRRSPFSLSTGRRRAAFSDLSAVFSTPCRF